MRLVFSAPAFHQLSRLDKRIQHRILSKLDFYLSQKQPLRFAERLTDTRFGQWRFRIGDFRVVFDVAKDAIKVLAVGHRRDIYRKEGACRSHLTLFNFA